MKDKKRRMNEIVKKRSTEKLTLIKKEVFEKKKAKNIRQEISKKSDSRKGKGRIWKQTESRMNEA